MIIESILNIIKGAMLMILNLIPEINFNLNLSGVSETFIDILELVAYVLPVRDILLMFGIWFGIYSFNIAWKLIQRIWDALPFT